MPRILITGSSGQIGTNLGLKLLANGYDLVGIDRRRNTWTNKIATIIRDLTEISDEKRLIVKELGHLDLVIHFAANAKVHDLVVNPIGAMENIASTYCVLEFCRRNKLPLIFSSSREVYGDVQRYITTEADADLNLTESTYSASKVAGEALLYSYARCYGIRYIVFRFSNVYGRYDNDIDRMERVLPLFIREISNDRPITIFGPKKVLDFTHVDDCVAGVFAGIERLLNGQVMNVTINLATGTGHSLVEAAEQIGVALGKTPRISLLATRIGEVNRYVADLTRATQYLGYSPKISFADGIRQAVDWNVRWQSHSNITL